MTIPMRARETLDPDWKPGDFKLVLTEAGNRRIVYGCPKGKGLCSVALKPDALPNGHSWAWDGDAEKPTLTPSINCVGGCGWHGFITKGEMTP